MTSIPGGLPENSAAIYRFKSPAVDLPPQPGAADAESGHDHGRAAPLPTTELPHGSPVLAGLPSSSALRATLLAGRKARESAALAVRGRPGRKETHSPDALHADDGASLPDLTRAAARQHSSDDQHGQRNSHWNPPAAPAGAFLRSATADPSLSPPTHLASRALALPALCDAQWVTHGAQSMPGFLRETMQSLVLDLVRDLADKIERHAVRQNGLRTTDVAQPVREVCDEFLELMRPLYRRYVAAPSLYADACEVLCAVQPQLHLEMRQRGGAPRELARLMASTVYPLLPVLVMGCIPRPDAGAHADDGFVTGGARAA
ncbi:hypothetical protein GN316_15640 [Xylophilus sp. Kf1]|nr:hypothetical protein [Xylophilus sp. Kf1]